MDRYNISNCNIGLYYNCHLAHFAEQERKKSTKLYQQAFTDHRIMDSFDFCCDGNEQNNYSHCLVAESDLLEYEHPQSQKRSGEDPDRKRRTVCLTDAERR